MGKFSVFKVPLKQLSEGKHEFEYHLDKEFFTNMESTDIHRADVKVVLTVDYHNGLYRMSFDCKGTIVVLCDRCLDDLELPVDTVYDITVKYGDHYDDQSDDLLEIPESDNFLNVAYIIYDTVSLQVPIKHVHPLGKCNRKMSALLKRHSAGRGPQDSEDIALEEDLIDEMDQMDDLDAGQDTDPRWDALKDINPSDN